MEQLADRLLQRITGALTDVIRNGDPEHTYPGCINLSFSCVEGNIYETDFGESNDGEIFECILHVSVCYLSTGESLLMALKDVALSSGSACTSASLEPSYVLRAIGTDEDLAHSSIRLVVW